MAFQVSPGVAVKEIDLTNVIPAVSTSIGGFAGYFNSGPVGEIQLIGSEKELAEVFGRPGIDISAVSYYQAASFLKYGNALKVVRADLSAAKNAHEANSGHLKINNAEDYEGLSETALSNLGKFVARSPGSFGNSLQVAIINGAIYNGNTFQVGGVDGGFNSGASALPVKSSFDSSIIGGGDLADDEVHIVVIDEDGVISGTPGTVLEAFEYVSTTVGATKEDGTPNYIKNVLFNKSKYIYTADVNAISTIAAESTLADANDTDAFDATYTVTSSTTLHLVDKLVSLSGGVGIDENTTATPGEITAALDLFIDSETEDVNLLFAHVDADGSNTIAEGLLTVANSRKDAIAFVSPPIADTEGAASPLTNVKTFVDSLTSTSYGFADSGAIKVYDKYNDRYLYIPASGFIAGLCANTDSVAEPWFSPAGLNRGQLFGVTKLAYNPKKADRDELYKARVNPIVSAPGQGTVLFGDKTLLSKPSAFDRINVRRLFIVLQKAISTAAKFQLFELNDEFTRAMFRNMVEPFLRDVKGRRGITDFAVICDETNNTGDIIDTNRFVADIYIKPARSINFITLNFVATRTDVEFSEIIGK